MAKEQKKQPKKTEEKKPTVKKSDKEKKSGKGRVLRFREYDRLADHFEKYCDVDRILKEIK